MGLRAAINGMCKSCIFDPQGGGGNWRQQVTACTSAECPLYPYRPLSKPEGPRNRSKARPGAEKGQTGAAGSAPSDVLGALRGFQGRAGRG